MIDLTPDLLETRLRDALGGLRPTEGAPPALRGRIDAIPARLGARGLGWTLRRIARSPLAGLTVVAAATFGVALLIGRPVMAPLPPGGVVANPPAFDPLIEGPGILLDAPIVLPVATGLVAIACLAIALRALLRWRHSRRWRDLIVGGAFVAIAAGGLGLAAEPSFEWGNSYGSGIGYTMVESLPGTTGEQVNVLYSVVGPNQPTAVVFDVRNPGLLPITLLGVVEDPNLSAGTNRWTAVWLGRNSNVIGDFEDAGLFAPRTVAPGDNLVVYLVGRSSRCAYGPGGESAQDVGGYTNRGRTLRLAYSVVGLAGTADLTLPMEIVEPIRSGPCP
jgi:hypothetical protein